jgi:hypothetical protein
VVRPPTGIDRAQGYGVTLRGPTGGASESERIRHAGLLRGARRGRLECLPDLSIKVRAATGASPTPRLLAAVTMFHVWLLLGRPDRRAWRYRERVQHSIMTVTQLRALMLDGLTSAPSKISAGAKHLAN